MILQQQAMQQQTHLVAAGKKRSSPDSVGSEQNASKVASIDSEIDPELWNDVPTSLIDLGVEIQSELDKFNRLV